MCVGEGNSIRAEALASERCDDLVKPVPRHHLQEDGSERDGWEGNEYVCFFFLMFDGFRLTSCSLMIAV